MEQPKANDAYCGNSLTVLEAPLMAAESAKRLVSQGHGRSYQTVQHMSLQDREQPKWSWSLNLAGFGGTIGAALPVGYCIGVVNSPAVVRAYSCL